MSSRSPIWCPICKEAMGPDQRLQTHLIHDHEPGELASLIVAEWEAKELEEAT